MVFSEVRAEHDEAFNRWYNEEHLPERLSIPGVLNAARYEAVAGGPKYLACYELASPDAWYADAWQKWRTTQRHAIPASAWTAIPNL